MMGSKQRWSSLKTRSALVLIGILGSPALLLAERAEAAICDASGLSCPGTGTCVISSTASIGQGCVIDFGLRDVELTGTLQAENAGGAFSIRAGSLRLNGGKLKALGDSIGAGGNIGLQIERGFVMDGTGSMVDAHANAGGGSISISAGSIAALSGIISVQGGNGSACGDGGTVALQASGGLLDMRSTIRANAPGNECSGGTIELSGIDVAVAGEVDARGGGGASDDAIVIRATGGDLRVESSAYLRADGTGQPDGHGSDAGSVELAATDDILLNGGTISVTGKAPDGAGGSVDADAGANMLVAVHVLASGAADGVGGEILLNAAGQLTVSNELSAHGGEGASFGQGGTIELRAGQGVTTTSDLDVSGATGGSITVRSIGPGSIGGRSFARGIRVKGGIVTLSSCALAVDGTLDVSGANGAQGGFVNVAGGTVGISASAVVVATPCSAGGCVSYVAPATGWSVAPGASVTPAAIATGSTTPDQCP